MNAHEVPESALLSIQQNMQHCSIAGVNYCVSNHYDAGKLVLTELKNLAGQYICFADVNSIIMAKKNPAYRDILSEAILVFLEGEQIAKRQRKRYYSYAKSVACSEFMKLMFLVTSDGDVKHYFYGPKETMGALIQYLHKEYPKLNICGIYTPPYGELTSEEDVHDIERINESGANIIWVGLGMPEQERWMNAHKGKVNAVMLGVSSGFELFARTRKPKGWFWRYLVTNIIFQKYLFEEISKI